MKQMAHILEYRFGRVRIDGKVYHHDVLVCEDEVLSPWVRREGHSLYPDDLEWLMPRKPRTLIIGTGAFGRLRVPGATQEWLKSQGIELIALPTKAAITEYNRHASGHVACGLHLTC